ncbi:MAG TPA: YbaK/EbsC family protein [Vicinamibacterales bacterium]|nr:YbaK/EbsC family protein [Vicinamibacterales bacterium]
MHTNAQRVQTALRAQGSSAQVVHMPDSTRTAAEAAAALGTTVGQIVKSLVFIADDGPVLVLTSGSERVSLEKLRAIVGGSVMRADADTVKRLTGYAIGGVPPLAHSTPARVLMDPHLHTFDIVWAAAGTPHDVFGIAPADLQKVAAAEVADVTE